MRRWGTLRVYKNLLYSLKFALHPSTRSIEQVHHPSLHINQKHPAAKMVLVPVAIGGMLGLALASPFPEAQPEAQVSLPPLIPSVPGFAQPINQLSPPLPVLQVPTPALESPPFTGSDIKPKKIGYFWTGAGDNQHKGNICDECC